MSMIRCDRCDRLIDSDDDPGCFVEGNPSGCFCQVCRDEAEEESRQERREFSASQQALIDRIKAEHDPDVEPIE